MSASLAWIAWNLEIGWPNAPPSLALAPPPPPRGHADWADVEDVQKLPEAAATGSQEILLGHAAVGERERAGVRCVPAHLAVRLSRLVSRCRVRDEEIGDLLVAVLLCGDRGDRHNARDVRAGVGDELLGA